MGQRVIYVMTHDSIGLGEDGPTHQPIEHLAALRAMPNLLVFRPADAVETAECWAAGAAQKRTGPSVLALTRQALPTLRTEHTDGESLRPRRLCAGRGRQGRRKVTLIATGSEVVLAVEARAQAAKPRASARRVVSMPCWELFDAQAAAYREGVLGADARARRDRGRLGLRLGALCRRRRRGRSA